MVQERVFLKRGARRGGGGWHFSNLVFERFIIFTFTIIFIKKKSF